MPRFFLKKKTHTLTDGFSHHLLLSSNEHSESKKKSYKTSAQILIPSSCVLIVAKSDTPPNISLVVSSASSGFDNVSHSHNEAGEALFICKCL